MLIKQVRIYSQLFSKSFYFDKFDVNNIYQYPKIKSLNVQFIISPKFEINKFNFSKLFLFFYLVSGQRPHFLVKNCNVKSNQCSKSTGLQLTIHKYAYFFDFLTRRQMPLLISGFKSMLLTLRVFVVKVLQKIQDDDILFQALQILDSIKYQVYVQSNSLSSSHLQTLLINFKIPLKN